MFGVLLITLLLTIALVGSNMDIILKQGIVYQVRTEITENTAIADSFASIEEFENYVQGICLAVPPLNLLFQSQKLNKSLL